MKLIVVTGASGAGKTTVVEALGNMLDSKRFACLDTDRLGLSWWDYAGTENEAAFSDDCLKAAVEQAAGRDLILSSCLNPSDYLLKHNIPEGVDSTQFIVLCPSDEALIARLRARPVEWGFGTDEAIRPHVEYNQWFRKNKGKFPLWLDNTDWRLQQTAEEMAALIRRWTE